MSSSRTRLIRLLERGFYPVELPPPFQTRNFHSVINTLKPPANYRGSTTFFDGSTFRGDLRTFGVINPVSYFLISKHIADNWVEITKIFNLSNCSGTRPKFPSLNADGRAIRFASLTSKKLGQHRLASLFPVILNLDINRFYESIYTHSIPWVVIGKDEAKQLHRTGNLSEHWSDKLDTFSRNSNQGQTVGLPIGPDTSRIISELILSRIDSEIPSNDNKLHFSQIYHNIDDYQIGTYGLNDAENAQSCFVRAISRYGLRLNDFKTTIDHGLTSSPANFQRHFDILAEQRGQQFVEHFFEILYFEIPKHPDSNVLGYALKRFAPKLARNREKELVCEYLQRLLLAVPHLARWLLPLLLGFYKAKGVNTGIQRLIVWGVEISTRRNDVGTLLWFLYAALFLRIQLRTKSVELCLGMSSELVDIMLFHGFSKALFSRRIATLRKRYRNGNFQTSAWLPLYEVERRAWDISSAFKKIGQKDDKKKLFEHLHDNYVEFYLTDQKYFQVEAFDGWKLTTQTFSEDEPDDQKDDWLETDIENYD